MAMRANRPHTGADAACQLDLFDDTLVEPEHARAELPVAKDTLHRSNASLEVVAIEPAEPNEPADGGSHAGADRATLAALETALADARAARRSSYSPPDSENSASIPLGRRQAFSRCGRRATIGCVASKRRGRARARSSRTESRSTTCSTGRRRTGGASSRRPRSSTIWARTGSGHAPRRRRTTGAFSSCANSSAGSANAKASATRSSTSIRRRSRGRNATG